MHRNWIVIAVLTFASAGQALAQDSEEQQGAYIGGGVGNFAWDLATPAGAQFDEEEAVFKLFGGYRFNQFFALQLDYLDLGSSEDTQGSQTVQVETSGFVGRIEGTIPLAFFELFATAGLAFSSVEASFNNTAFIDESGNDPVYSVGAGFEIGERLVLRLEYEILDLDALDADSVWFTVGWRL